MYLFHVQRFGSTLRDRSQNECDIQSAGIAHLERALPLEMISHNF